MEIKQLEIDNQVIEYQLNTKRIKKCYLKIVSGKIIINAPLNFPIKTIEKLILDHKDIVLKKISTYVPKFNYINGGYVYIFNHQYQIVLKDINEHKAVIHKNKIYVYYYKIQETIENELKNILYDYLIKQIYYYLDTKFYLVMPKIEIKKFKSRWGACFSRQNRISFNLALVHLDKNLIDYVIIHELCHFIQPNHSKFFYQEIDKRLPDYRIREKKLREIEI